MTLTFPIVATIFFLHWLGDFVFQSQRMAENKKWDHVELLMHVAVYGFTIFWVIATIDQTLRNQFFVWWSINVLLHLLIDAVTSRASAWEWEKKNVHDFFVIIGLDQMAHMMCLFGTFFLLMR